MGLKNPAKSAADANPGPGAYDVHDSTIGNWGAGMEAHVPQEQDTSLQERITAFARGAQEPSGHAEAFWDRYKAAARRGVAMRAKPRRAAARRTRSAAKADQAGAARSSAWGLKSLLYDMA